MPRILSPEDSQVGDGDRVGLAHGGSSSWTLAVAVLRYIQQSSEFKLFSNLFCTVPVVSTGKKTPGGAGTRTGHKDTRITQTNLTSAIQTHQRTTPVTTPEAEPTDPRPTQKRPPRANPRPLARLPPTIVAATADGWAGAPRACAWVRRWRWPGRCRWSWRLTPAR